MRWIRIKLCGYEYTKFLVMLGTLIFFEFISILVGTFMYTDDETGLQVKMDVSRFLVRI